MIGVTKEQENCSTNSFTVIKKTGYPRIMRHEPIKSDERFFIAFLIYLHW